MMAGEEGAMKSLLVEYAAKVRPPGWGSGGGRVSSEMCGVWRVYMRNVRAGERPRTRSNVRSVGARNESAA